MESPFHLIVLMLHVLGAAIIVGSAFISVLMLMKEKISRESLVLLDNIWRIAGPMVGLQILTGFYLASFHWDELGVSVYFWIKMFLIVLEGILGGMILSKKIKMYLAKKDTVISWPGASKSFIITFFIYSMIALIGVYLAETI